VCEDNSIEKSAGSAHKAGALHMGFFGCASHHKAHFKEPARMLDRHALDAA
jgi:hypothetical protein